jgi:hypothetical protein
VAIMVPHRWTVRTEAPLKGRCRGRLLSPPDIPVGFNEPDRGPPSLKDEGTGDHCADATNSASRWSSLRASNPIAYTWHDGAGRKIITMTPELLGIRGFIHFVLFLISFYFGKAAFVAKSTMSLLCPRTSI